MICKLCSKPVAPEQGMNGATGDHWDCSQELFRRVDADIVKIGLSRRPKCTEGKGRLAQRVVGMVRERLEALGYSGFSEPVVWTQQGAHRGWKSDLASWGVDFMAITSFGDEEIRVQVSVSCWGTMTQIAKEGSVRLVNNESQGSGKIPHDFDCF